MFRTPPIFSDVVPGRFLVNSAEISDVILNNSSQKGQWLHFSDLGKQLKFYYTIFGESESYLLRVIFYIQVGREPYDFHGNDQ